MVYGHEHMTEDGQLNFHDYRDEGLGLVTALWKRTLYGYCWAHDGVMIDNTPATLSQAIRRQTAARCPEYMCGYDSWLRVNSRVAIAQQRDQVVSLLAVLIAEAGGAFTENICDSAAILAVTPHPKLALRANEYDSRSTTGTWAELVWLHSCEWKLKTIEYAKFLKFARFIVDLGVAASLQGARFFDWAKHILGDKKIVVNNSCFIFVTAPDPEIITAILLEVIRNSYSRMFVVFSDDCCASIYGKYANFDISSCDASHEAPLFHQMFDALQTPDEIRTAMIGQISALIRIHNPTFKNEVVLMVAEYLYLQSGWTGTTLINVFAWLNIFLMCERLNASTPFEVVQAARLVGYILTYQECHQPEDLQFLKMSLAETVDGDYYAVLNLGVILRASGCCKGDLIHNPLEFQTALMDGLLAFIDCPELEQLNPHHKPQKPININLADYSGVLGVLNLQNGRRRRYTLEALTQRYLPSACKLEQFRFILANLKLGRYSYDELGRDILEKDYSLGAPNREQYKPLFV